MDNWLCFIETLYYVGISQFYSQPMLNNVPGTTRTLSPNKALALS